LSDEDDAHLAMLRRREERLRASGWNLYAAAYRFLTRWRNVDIRGGETEVPLPSEEVLREFVARRGPPPPPFRPAADPLACVSLPHRQPSGDLYRALASRRTTRSFDGSRTLALDDFALVLDQVFGCHGYASTAGGEIVTLKRTSPSAGGLHPIEAFPLVVHVDGVQPGLYHYDAERHALEMVESLEHRAARKLATECVCGQTYFGSAHALVFFVARFERTHWKYQRHPKAYASILLDAGHLSQTLYLLAAELGLGAFVTTVINDAAIDERLGLDGVDEGTVAVCGLGIPGERSPLDPVFLPFEPRTGVAPNTDETV